MRKLWLRFWLAFNGIVTCKHLSRGLYYCVVCEEDKISHRLVARETQREKLARLRKEMESL